MLATPLCKSQTPPRPTHYTLGDSPGRRLADYITSPAPSSGLGCPFLPVSTPATPDLSSLDENDDYVVPDTNVTIGVFLQVLPSETESVSVQAHNKTLLARSSDRYRTPSSNRDKSNKVSKMYRPILSLALAFTELAAGLGVAPGSPCSSQCGNTLSSTTGADMTCTQGDYSGTSNGIVLNNCLSCQSTSGYVSGNQSDLDWFLCKSPYPTPLIYVSIPSATY